MKAYPWKGTGLKQEIASHRLQKMRHKKPFPRYGVHPYRGVSFYTLDITVYKVYT